MRPIFWGLLAETAQRAGARIRLNTTVAAIEQARRTASSASSRTARSGTWDLVVGADGLHSRVRELVFPDAPEPFVTGQTVWRAVVPRPPDMSDDMVHVLRPSQQGGLQPGLERRDVRLRHREHTRAHLARARGVAPADPGAARRVQGPDRLGARTDDRSRADRSPPAPGDPPATALVPRVACS